ncbi:MDR family NADP-dependent oxidoreductase [Streptomyces olivaceus]|uniref:MDR family NADP-dependent oxidoreductase n=1 Tax=Streptomyces olivaceus TaxID=47716 RepID=UPI00069406D8|nr:NADP-dependent oxidoreductase [Streptomyces olivaceus]MBZ6100875.1 NADP-dependent oxidoreductase [Streptomyces olivaceus]
MTTPPSDSRRTPRGDHGLRTHREVRLAARPAPGARLTDDLFEIAEVPTPSPEPGRLLVRTRVMSVAAVMRTLMDETTDVPMRPFALGEPLYGPAIGEVVAAPGTGFVPGDLVQYDLGWREFALLDPSDVQGVDPGLLPDPAAYLSQGPTAWMAVTRGAEVGPGDTVFVTGAAGGVGSLAGQAARLRGARRVIGSVGSQHKAAILREELGYDAVVLRGAGPIEDQLRAVAPEGVDAVIDSVGGEQLQASIAVANRGARIGLVGALDAQLTDSGTPTTAIDTFSLLTRGITLRGTVLHTDHLDLIPEWHNRFGAGLRDGTLAFPHARLHGLDNAPRALRELVEGRHVGAVLVEL